MSYQSLENEFTQFAHRLNVPNADAGETIAAVKAKRDTMPAVKSFDELAPMTRRELFDAVMYNELWITQELSARREEIAVLLSLPYAEAIKAGGN